MIEFILLGFVVGILMIGAVVIYNQIRLRDEIYKRVLSLETHVESLNSFRTDMLIWRDTYFRRKRDTDIPEVREVKEYQKRKKELAKVLNNLPNELREDVNEELQRREIDESDIYPNT